MWDHKISQPYRPQRPVMGIALLYFTFAVTFYGDCVKICEDFTPNFGDKKLIVASPKTT
jgi:hypothetical protein